MIIETYKLTEQEERERLYNCINLIGSNLEIYYAKGLQIKSLEQELREAFKIITVCAEEGVA